MAVGCVKELLLLSTSAANQNRSSDSQPPQTSAAMRRFRRKPVIWAATLEAGSGIFDCVILDLSSGGARLKISQTVPLNQPAVLTFGSFGTFPCTIVRSSPEETGVQFTETPETIVKRLGEILPLQSRG